MKKLCFCWLLIFFIVGIHSSIAQILDEGVIQEATPSIIDTKAPSGNDDSEDLFNELFSDKDITEREPDRIDNFNSAAENVAKTLKETGTINEIEQKRLALDPIQGDLKIGVVPGSFRVFQNFSGKTLCTFNIVLKSEINRNIKTMGLRLIYPHAAFAFVFRDVKAKASQVRTITTSGNICYTFGGVPDIEVNLCRIVNTVTSECAKRLKWDNNLEAANPQE